MARTDHAGRPIIVVTGMGVVTSLGAGREDNWRKLTAGESGIREITRFSTEGMKTRIAGVIDFVSLFEIGGGMPTRVTIPESKLDDVIAKINDAPQPTPRAAARPDDD